MKYAARIGILVLLSMTFLLREPGNDRVWSFMKGGQNAQAIEPQNRTHALIIDKSSNFHNNSQERCLQCHPRLSPSHMLLKPVRVSQYLDLDFEGKMQCITCHNCSSNKCDLRRNKTELCMMCHACKEGMSCILGVAHLGNSDNDIDLDAHTCLACHDGVIGPSKNAEGLMLNKHYRVKNNFRDMSNTGITIVDGIITCISCHNPYISEDKRLVVPNEGNKLCLSCHKK